jgi:hypothetical protein
MVDSSSTLAEVEAAYDDNASYRDTANITMARAFTQACRILVRRYVSGIAVDGASTSRNVDLIKQQLSEAEAWLDGADPARSGASTVSLDFRDARQ